MAFTSSNNLHWLSIFKKQLLELLSKSQAFEENGLLQKKKKKVLWYKIAASNAIMPDCGNLLEILTLFWEWKMKKIMKLVPARV